MRPLSLAGLLALALITSACATGPLAEAQPTLDNLQRLRSPDIPAMALGEFKLAPGKPASMDRVVAVRAGTASPPEGKSFARYLARTLETELRAAGKLDPASPLAVSGLLTRSAAGAGLDKGSAELGAVFKIERSGTAIYEKELVVEDAWDDPNFIGAIAIPEAFDRYTALYARLVGQFLADSDFRAAVRP